MHKEPQAAQLYLLACRRRGPVIDDVMLVGDLCMVRGGDFSFFDLFHPWRSVFLFRLLSFGLVYSISVLSLISSL